MADIQGIVDQIKEMTLLEASQLVKLMEETFGVSAAAAVNGSASATKATATASSTRKPGEGANRRRLSYGTSSAGRDGSKSRSPLITPFPFGAAYAPGRRWASAERKGGHRGCL